MKKDVLIYLDHIRECIARINAYTKGMDESGFM
jgi:uncharacterized protein with HEPN domain